MRKWGIATLADPIPLSWAPAVDSSVLARSWLLFFLLAAWAVSAAAQGTSRSALPHPNAALGPGFVHVTSVRELSDGRLIIVDSYDRSIKLVDAAFSKTVPIGSSGAGPGEYRAPAEIIAIWGDSSIVPDPANRRALVLGPDGAPSGFRKLYFEGDGAPTLGATPMKAADLFGNFYGQRPPIARRQNSVARIVDSAAIIRWRHDSQSFDTVAFVPEPIRAGSIVVGGTVARIGDVALPFASQPQWAASPDGRVAIVYLEPYRVDIIDRNGTRHRGAAIRYRPLKLTEAHKRVWREIQRQPAPALSVTRGGEQTSGMRVPPSYEPQKWPDRLPPFLPGAVRFSTDGRLWIERTTEPGEGPLFDVIDKAGNVIEQVQLPPRTRLVGFGRRSLYIVRRDDLDVEHLERYALPGGGK